MPSPTSPLPELPGAPVPGAIAALILAAGESSRMGSAKQLLPFRGTTLLRHSIQTALAAELDPVLVVLGAHADRLAHELTDLPVRVVTNTNWSAGIGASIRAGVAAVPASADAVLILLADQPLITTDFLRHLITEHHKTAAPIVAAAYGGTVGVPALFARSLFRDLANLPDLCGAKAVIERTGSAVRTIAFPNAAIDLDTPADVKRFKAR